MLHLSIGGYWRKTTEGGNPTDNSAYHHFDDVYIDSTLSRIILGDNSKYSQCTITEPQIPKNVWNDTTVEIEVNLGKFSASENPIKNAFLFIFDADNNCNCGEIPAQNAGYPITLIDNSSNSETTTNNDRNDSSGSSGGVCFISTGAYRF